MANCETVWIETLHQQFHHQKRQSSQATVRSTEPCSNRWTDFCKTLLFPKQTKRSQLNWAPSVLRFYILQSLCECNTGTFKPMFLYWCYTDNSAKETNADRVLLYCCSPPFEIVHQTTLCYLWDFFSPSFSQAEQPLSQSHNVNSLVTRNCLLYKDKYKEGTTIQ